MKQLTSLGWESKWVLSVDTGPYTIPTKKMMKDGLADQIVMWTGNWLYGHAQKVVIKNMKSSWRSVSNSVLQGSTPGPILFSTFINHLVNKWTLSKSADDTKEEGVTYFQQLRQRPQQTGEMA